MRVSLLVFRLPPGTPNAEVGKFVKKLYGQATSSWGGKYTYRRPGLLDGVPHRKLLRGVVIVQRKDLAKVLAFLGEWNALVEVREIRPTVEDLQFLEKEPSAHGGGW
ncbi:MAG: hypothetical protein IVW52_19995 [Acidimicrobiales bacterium]|nr:hypothetical protein [Acidimicrobiales bacterium]